MPIHDYKSQRLFIDQPLQVGSLYQLERNQANYLISVLRMKNSDKLLVFNGKDGEWVSELEVTGRKSGTLKMLEQKREQPKANDLVYCFAPLKQARLDYLIQKAVEMGVGRLQPVMTDYTQANRLKPERIHANGVEAAEQCGILTIPEISEPTSLEQLIANWQSDRILVFADEAANEKNPIDELKMHCGKPMGLLVGPEGGFSPQERQMLMAFDNVLAVNLGPRILRADTAGVAALALIQACCGDW